MIWRSVAGPGRLSRRHVAPPSCVAQRSGPNAQPSSISANHRPLTPVVPDPPSTKTVSGAGIPAQVRPPSVVRTIAAHGDPAHVADPRSQPASALVNVAEAAWKSVGMGPPTGPG